jgi:phosphodiesterase/alkaline phosphatase D-like protein
VLFGIKPGEYSVMWCTPREDMTQRDNVAFLRRGVKLVQGWYEDFGTIYVPVHKEWEAVKDLVLFLGFTILDDGGIAVYDGESDD